MSDAASSWTVPADDFTRVARERDEARAELGDAVRKLADWGESAVGREIQSAYRARDEARAEVERLTHALHDIRAILGFDNDGDPTPAAPIAGAGSVEKYIEWVLRDVREHRADDDELLAELKQATP